MFCVSPSSTTVVPSYFSLAIWSETSRVLALYTLQRTQTRAHMPHIITPMDGSTNACRLLKRFSKTFRCPQDTATLTATKQRSSALNTILHVLLTQTQV